MLKTKYVLNSGGVGRQPELKKQFHQEIIKDLDGTCNFLICCFAQPREHWEAKFPIYSSSVAEDLLEGLEPKFELAMPDIFADQCQRSDVIYFSGGDDYLVQYWMRQFDLPKMLKGKVVATNSASSDMLANSFWPYDWQQCKDGLGILPIKFIPHYLASTERIDPRGLIDWQKAYTDLKNYGDTSLPTHALKEGQFIVIEQ